MTGARVRIPPSPPRKRDRICGLFFVLHKRRRDEKGTTRLWREKNHPVNGFLVPRAGGGLLTFRLAGSGDVTVTENGKVVKPDADGWYTVSAGARIVVDYPVMVLPKTGDMPVWRWLLGL